MRARFLALPALALASGVVTIFACSSDRPPAADSPEYNYDQVAPPISYRDANELPPGPYPGCDPAPGAPTPEGRTCSCTSGMFGFPCGIGLCDGQGLHYCTTGGYLIDFPTCFELRDAGADGGEYVIPPCDAGATDN